MTQIIERVDGL